MGYKYSSEFLAIAARVWNESNTRPEVLSRLLEMGHDLTGNELAAVRVLLLREGYTLRRMARSGGLQGWSSPRREKAYRLRDQGLTLQEIANRLECSKQRIHQFLQERASQGE